MRIPELTEHVKIPEGVQVETVNTTVKVKGPKGDLERDFKFQKIDAKVEGNKIMLTVKGATKKEKTQVGTMKAHVKNMVKGVTGGHVYKLKICSGHFPMNVTVSGDTFNVKNFLGEKVPRTIKIKEGATVKVEGTEVSVESIDIEKAGQVAADIEQLTRIKNKDIRIFQDGIYIVEKPGK
ncbi:50S ribosomal protein L6 [Candidatus Woesearchaeota archaeon]|jgi:large subunit ribosomal protein L6|nr:50S ribosomal protein L6 [Candidatus Woesearchaeota archaeon]